MNERIKASWDDESWDKPDDIRPTLFQVCTGQVFMEALFDAAIQNDMGGIGGCKSFNMANFPEKFHDLIRAYLNKEMCSVEACFIAMSRESEPLDTPEWVQLTFDDIDDLGVSKDFLAGARWAANKLKEKNT